MTVADLISDPRLAASCRRHHVRRLTLFGSAARGTFEPTRSDLDFVVEFEPAPPVQHAAAYFGLLEELESMFGRPVDLLEPEVIRNEVLAREIERDRQVVFDAA